MNAGYPPPTPQPGPHSMPGRVLPLEVWGATDKGREREGNEDALYPHSRADTFPFTPSPERLAQRGQMLVVADGVGGAQAGSEASRWAVRVAVERYYDLSSPDLGADLQAAIGVANASLYQYLQSTGTREAGSTMAAAVIHGNMLYVANVGDSRVYLVRDGAAHQLTRDHTLTQRKIEQGLIEAGQAELDPDRNVLTRSLGSAPTVQVDLFPPLQLAAGDIVLLCSDGLPDMVSDAEIARLAEGPPKQAARRLIAAANRRGGFDNISVVLARVGGKKPAAGGAVGGLHNLLPRSIRAMSRWQRIVLLVEGVLVALTLCLMGVLGWIMYEGAQSRSTPSEPAVTGTTSVATVAPTGPTPVPGIGVTTPISTTAVAPTSTLRPTSTPPPLPTPRRLTPTATPIPPTEVPVPSTPTRGEPVGQPTLVPAPPPSPPPPTNPPPPMDSPPL